MSIRYQYSRQINPPAPFIRAGFGRPTAEASSLVELPAQIDTAADFTVVPQSLVAALQLVQLDEMTVLGFGGHQNVVPVYLVKLAIHDLPPLFVRVLAAREEPYALLGRDVLNRFQIVLDGPNTVLEIDGDG